MHAKMLRRGSVVLVMAVAGALVTAVSPAGAARPAPGPNAASIGSGFDTPGNVLIADQFNNRVVEVDQSGHIVWQFGKGPHDFTAQSIIGVNDAQRVGPLTLMAGTGDPAGSPPPPGDLCPDTANGCADNRVMLVDPFGNVVWQYGMTGVMGNKTNQLNNPNSAELLPNGNILIADENNNRAIEVNRNKHIVHTFTAGGTANGVAFASRLRNGDTLLTDSGNNRVVEVDSHDAIVWQYATNNQMGSNPSPLPTRALRLANGDTLISDQFNHRVIEVTPAKMIARQLGTLNIFGYDKSTVGPLDAPYDAKVVGDYTGITPPFGP